MSALYLLIFLMFIFVLYEFINYRTYFLLNTFSYFRNNIELIIRYSLRDLKKKYIRENAKRDILLLLAYLSAKISHDKLKEIDKELRQMDFKFKGDDYRTHLAKATIKASISKNETTSSQEYIRDVNCHMQRLHELIDIKVIRENNSYFFNLYIQVINAYMAIKDYKKTEKLLTQIEHYEKNFTINQVKIFHWYKGLMYVKTNKEVEAAKIFENLRDFFRNEKMEHGDIYLFMIERTLGNYYGYLGELSKALLHYQDAKDLSSKIEMKEMLSEYIEEIEINISEITNK